MEENLVDTASRLAVEMNEEGTLKNPDPDQDGEVISDFIFDLEERSQE